MNVKWDGNQIISFLNLYEKYDILWNIQLKDHMNKARRETAFEKLLKELQETGFENIDMNILKARIKTIKTVYRQEVNKIVKSKKSGSGTDDLYKPKLMWFARADSFLRSMVINRETTNNMDVITQQETVETDAEEAIPPESPSAPHSFKRNKPSSISQNLKPNKSSRNIISGSGVDKAIESLKEIVDKNQNKPDDQYDSFAKHISAQLKELPLRSFIILQGQIQELINRERLAQLPFQQQMHQQFDSRPSTSTSHYLDIGQQPLQHFDTRQYSRLSTAHSHCSDLLQQARVEASIESDNDFDNI
ncbi:hypothetical protein FQR65_LT16772 [Abscondita terminalis]|nr:hypothetical protein FQR65_LT16772 [Abscondita terminalis]